VSLICLAVITFGYKLGGYMDIETQDNVIKKFEPLSSLCTSCTASTTISKEYAIGSTWCASYVTYPYLYMDQNGTCQKWTCANGYAAPSVDGQTMSVLIQRKVLSRNRSALVEVVRGIRATANV